jgi:hypothetical protein
MRPLAKLLIAALVTLAVAAPVSAGSPESARSPEGSGARDDAHASGKTGSGSHGSGIYDEYDWNDAGTDTGVCDRYVVDWAEGGHVVIRDATAATDFQFFYFTSRWSGHSTVRNPANGRSFTEHWAFAYKEQDARRLTTYPGFVFAYEGNERGSYRVANARGRTVYRDSGRVIISYVFDTLGESTPGGAYLEDPVELKNTWKNQDFDFCKLADRLIR